VRGPEGGGSGVREFQLEGGGVPPWLLRPFTRVLIKHCSMSTTTLSSVRLVPGHEHNRY
jgi:hypothetical protein